MTVQEAEQELRAAIEAHSPDIASGACAKASPGSEVLSRHERVARASRLVVEQREKK